METDLTAPLTLIDVLGLAFAGIVWGALGAFVTMALSAFRRIDEDADEKLRTNAKARGHTETETVAAALRLLDEMDEQAKK